MRGMIQSLIQSHSDSSGSGAWHPSVWAALFMVVLILCLFCILGYFIFRGKSKATWERASLLPLMEDERR